MAKFNTTIVTDAGKELFAKVRAGKEQLTWTKAQMYYANDADKISNEAFKKATLGTFGDAIKETDVGVVDIKGTTVTISSSFLNQNQLSDLNFNLVGWFANSSLDQEEKLVAITPSVGDQVLTAGATDGKATASIDLVLAIDVGDANIVKITPVEEGLIDHTELNNALALLASKGLINTGNDITSSQNINLDEHFNTSLQYIDSALNDIDYGTFSGTGWLVSFGNKDNKNNQNNVQFVVDSGTDGNGVSALLYRTYNASSKNWNDWTRIVTSSNITDFLPYRVVWSNNTDSDDVTQFGSGVTYDMDNGYRMKLNLGIILNEITWGSPWWDDDTAKRILSTDGKSGTTENLLINHAQLMQELGNYYTKKDIDAQNFVKTVNDIKPDDKGNVDLSGVINARPLITYSKDAKKYGLDKFNTKTSKFGTYQIYDVSMIDSRLLPPDITKSTAFMGVDFEVQQSDGADLSITVINPFDGSIYKGRIGYTTSTGELGNGTPRWKIIRSDDNYYDRKTIDKKISDTGKVKTVNNVKPDNNGNVEISIADYCYSKQESDDRFETKRNHDLDKFSKTLSNSSTFDGKALAYGIVGKYYLKNTRSTDITNNIPEVLWGESFFLENIVSDDGLHVLQVITAETTLDTYKRTLKLDTKYDINSKVVPTVLGTLWKKFSGVEITK